MLNILEPNTEDLTTLTHSGNAKAMIKDKKLLKKE